MLVCPLYDREFGSMSLNIHMKSCKEKFERQQRDLPLIKEEILIKLLLIIMLK